MTLQAAPAAGLLAAVAREDSVAAPLAQLHLAIAAECVDPVWDLAVPPLDSARLREGLPLLHRQPFAVDARRVRATLHMLLEAARQQPAARDEAVSISRAVERGALAPMVLLEVSICQETDGVAAQAMTAGVSFDLLAVVGQLLALPLLRAAGRSAAPLLAGATWDAGYCPVCASWPALAERRGLERKRLLRCGRCAAEWTYALHRCPFCGNRDHKLLGYLAPEEQREARQAATCDACHAYLKSVATIGALSAEEIVAHDLMTLELDMAAAEAGFARPDDRAFPLVVTVSAAAPERRSGWLAWRR